MKRVARILGVVVVSLLLIAIIFPSFIDADQFRPALESRLTIALGREVKLGNLRASLFPAHVTASDLSIADDTAFSKTSFLLAHSLKAGVEMLPLVVSHKLNVTGITIEQPEIDLIETPAGVFNFSSIGAKSGTATAAAPPTPSSQTPDLSIALIKISGGRITLKKIGSKNKPLILDKLDIEIRNFAADAQFPFSLSAALSGNGTIGLDGTAGPIAAGDALKTPFNARLKLTHLDLSGSGLVDPVTGIAGLVSVNGSAESLNGAINLTGKLVADQLILAKGGTPAKRPVEVDLVLSHSLGNQTGEVHRMAIHLGSAVANLSGTYSLAKDPANVHLKLVASRMPLQALATFLPAMNIALPSGASIDEGTADVNLASDGPLGNLVTAGNVDAENARLSNYDFASKLKVLREFTGIKAQPHTLIQTLRANVRNAEEATALDNIQFAVASVGAITGAGTITASHRLDFKMHANPAAGALAVLSGKEGIPFSIQGTAENPSIKPDVKGIVTSEMKDLTHAKSAADAASGLLKGLFGGKNKQ